MSIRLPALCLLLLVGGRSDPSIVASARRPSLAVALDSVASSFADRREFSGAVLVADHGTVIFERAYGLANREWQVPMTTGAVFRIGSTTKQFTAALVLCLVEDGKLRLDGRVSDYLPTYPKPQGDQIRIRDLLTHSSGIPDYTSLSHFMQRAAAERTTADALVARFDSLPLEFAPGSKWSYSNSGYALLADILEHVSGESYARLLATRIAGPLGLKTLAVDGDDFVPHRAYGYVPDGDSLVPEPRVDATAAYGAGMIRSSARDLLAWDQSLYDGRVFKSPATALELVTPRIETGLPLGRYGFGFFIGTQTLGGRPVRVIQHGGTISGFVTGFWRMPDDRRTVIVLSNIHAARTPDLVGALTEILYR